MNFDSGVRIYSLKHQKEERCTPICAFVFLLVLTLCRSNLKPYCMGRKAAFFQQVFKCTYYTRNRSPLQEKKNHNN